MADYIRPDRRRFNRLDERFTRRRRGKALVYGLSAAAFIYTAYSFGRAGPALKADSHARRVAEVVIEAQERPVSFATVNGTPLTLALPALKSRVLGIGYHQAYNVRAISLTSNVDSMGRATTQAVSKAFGAGSLPAFVMEARGRGSAVESSVDVALPDGSDIMSPVTGRVLAVVPYLLYGRINDVRIDIMAEGYPGFKISIVHLDSPVVTAGQKVEAGVTRLAVVRRLGISSQIDQYLGKAVAHVHIQANPIEASPVGARPN